MKYLTRQQVQLLKDTYPRDTRVVLDGMGDPQGPPAGTEGTVMFVDDIGTIHVQWDTGSTLGLIPGVDDFHKV